jgi:hypothetical protein
VNRVIALVHYFMHPEACALTVKIKHAVASWAVIILWNKAFLIHRRICGPFHDPFGIQYPALAGFDLSKGDDFKDERQLRSMLNNVWVDEYTCRSPPNYGNETSGRITAAGIQAFSQLSFGSRGLGRKSLHLSYWKLLFKGGVPCPKLLNSLDAPTSRTN